MKRPCKNCLILPICLSHKDFIKRVNECKLIQDFISKKIIKWKEDILVVPNKIKFFELDHTVSVYIAISHNVGSIAMDLYETRLIINTGLHNMYSVVWSLISERRINSTINAEYTQRIWL